MASPLYHEPWHPTTATPDRQSRAPPPLKISEVQIKSELRQNFVNFNFAGQVHRTVYALHSNPLCHPPLPINPWPYSLHCCDDYRLSREDLPVSLPHPEVIVFVFICRRLSYKYLCVVYIKFFIQISSYLVNQSVHPSFLPSLLSLRRTPSGNFVVPHRVNLSKGPLSCQRSGTPSLSPVLRVTFIR